MNLYEGQPESYLQKHVVNRLKCLARMGYLFFERRNAGRVNIGTRKIKLGTPGMADIIIYLPQGKVIFCELKTTTGQLNSNQELFRERIQLLGYEYFVIRDTESLDNILAINGIKI